MKDLRNIDFSTEKYFECDGKKFFVRESLSFVRYRELQKLMIEWGYSATFEDIFKNLNKALDAFNEHRYDKMCIIVHNVMNGIMKIEQKDDPSLRLCALFIDEENEDPAIYSDAMMKAKIDCWGKEISVNSFFYLAASLVPGWMPAYEITIKDGLNRTKEEEGKSLS